MLWRRWQNRWVVMVDGSSGHPTSGWAAFEQEALERALDALQGISFWDRALSGIGHSQAEVRAPLERPVPADPEKVRRALSELLDYLDNSILRSCGLSLSIEDTGVRTDGPPQVERYAKVVDQFMVDASAVGVDLAPYADEVRRDVAAREATLLRRWRFLVDVVSAREGDDPPRQLTSLMRASSDVADDLDGPELRWLFSTADQVGATGVFEWGLAMPAARSRALDRLHEGTREPARHEQLVRVALQGTAYVAVATMALLPGSVIARHAHAMRERLKALLPSVPDDEGFGRELVEVAGINLTRSSEANERIQSDDEVLIDVTAGTMGEVRWRVRIDPSRGVMVADPINGPAVARLHWSCADPGRVEAEPLTPDEAPADRQGAERAEDDYESPAPSVGPVLLPHGVVRAHAEHWNAEHINLSVQGWEEQQVEVAWYGRRYPVTAAASANGRWAAFAWYTDKHNDHGWVEILDLHEVVGLVTGGGKLPETNQRQLYPNGEPSLDDSRTAKGVKSMAFSGQGTWFAATDNEVIHIYRVSDWPVAIGEHRALACQRRWAKVLELPRPDRLRKHYRLSITLASPMASAWLDSHTLVVATKDRHLLRLSFGVGAPVVEPLAETTTPLVGLTIPHGTITGMDSQGTVVEPVSGALVVQRHREHGEAIVRAMPHPCGWITLDEAGHLELLQRDSRALRASGVYAAAAANEEGQVAAVDSHGAVVVFELDGGTLAVKERKVEERRRFVISDPTEVMHLDHVPNRATAVSAHARGAFVVGMEDGCLYSSTSWSAPHDHRVTAVDVQATGDITTSGDASGEVYAGSPVDLRMELGAAIDWCSTSPGGKVVAAATRDGRFEVSVRPW